ncbi:hypothetical protein PAECIP112173_02488 [Paenibacillus sp. JJ-100]|uniref:hypothetical protein n=1 Tax=Paenibacillus sp. JJ-100 TaxID=2974896 RepID=UPI0022FF93DE|nr:hypothetical protein [Paenibacillus sp. JJ-100]CAI6077537.1 hypothetical protein PAECIP112173_02488 [Paenibacillus sp. JJ-100]
MRKKRWIVSIIILIFIIILPLSEFMLLSSEKVGILNTTYRFMSGALPIRTQGQTLSYHGKMQAADIPDIVAYSTSDEGTTLYKAIGTPVPPPWIYVKNENHTVFRYTYPHLPWKM